MKYLFLALVIVGVIEWLKKFFSEKIKGSKWMPLISALIATVLTGCYGIGLKYDVLTIVMLVVIEIAITQVFYDIIYKTLVAIKKAIADKFDIMKIAQTSADMVLQFLQNYGIVRKEKTDDKEPEPPTEEKAKQ